jgi:prolyl oligopeptidase
MRHLTPWFLLVLLTGLVLFTAGPALAQDKSVGPAKTVDDGARLFSADAREKANTEIAEIKRRYGKDLFIQTIAEAGKTTFASAEEKSQYFRKLALQKARNAGVDGIFVLISAKPRYLETLAGNVTRKRGIFTDENLRVLRDKFTRKLGKDSDGALQDAVEYVRQTLSKTATPKREDPGPARSDPPVAAGEPLKYPKTKRVDHVDLYHGVKVSDPYHWLEEDVREDKEVADWVAAENKVTFAYLRTISERDAIKRRLTELWDYEKVSPPHRAGPRYVYSKNNGLQNHSVYYTQETLTAAPEMLLDPNAWSKDGTVALAGVRFSHDGTYLAYGIAEAGSDWRHVKVMHVPSRKVLGDDLRWVKYGVSAAWTHDNKGFFYSRFPEPERGAKFQALPLNHRLYFHRLGTPQAEDVLVYRPTNPAWTVYGEVTDDGRYLVIEVGDGTTSRKNRVAYKDLNEPYGLPVDLIEDFDAVNDFICNDGPLFYFRTDRKASRGKVVAIDLRRPAPANWKEIIPEAQATLENVSFVGNQLICQYLKDAHSQVRIHRLDGRLVREVELPSLGSAAGFGGRPEDTETFFTFTSYNVPGRTYRLDLLTGKTSLFHEPKLKFNPDDYEVRQVFYPSKDGTKIPMYLSYKKGTKPDGDRPTVLYGYGGFNISLTPAFRVSALAWMEMGGVYAVANIRGGGEYGQDWHHAATKKNRPKAYEDFIAAAEWLIKHNYTKPERLAIQGGSNGGLLVGAVMCKRPDLFGACLPAVGVMDMLRFHKFTAGRFWVDDYGSADDPEMFKVLYSYSPYHNLRPETRYPATLVTTADTDDRVVPSHSFKFAARLQECQAGPAPVLIRIETRAGHGAGRPTHMALDEAADAWAFLVKNLKVQVPASYR